MKALINAIKNKHLVTGIEVCDPATITQIDSFEQKLGFPLPEDFREFYLTCNGFGCTEDIFNFLSLSAILDQPERGKNWFYFSEYMIYSDMWGVRIINGDQYEIFNGSYPERPLATSLHDFLTIFLEGNIFDAGGIYECQGKLGIG